MTYGFRVINDWGTVQIDDTYANLALKEVRQYTFQFDQGGTDYFLNFSFSGSLPVFAFRSPDSHSVVAAIQQNGSTYTVQMRSDLGGPVWIYIFDKPITPTSGYGLRVRNANNEITFDSGYKYMRIEGFYSSANGNQGLTPGKTYAVLQGCYFYSEAWITQEPPPWGPQTRGNIFGYYEGIKINNAIYFNTITKLIAENVGEYTYGHFGGRTDCLVIDVTNY